MNAAQTYQARLTKVEELVSEMDLFALPLKEALDLHWGHAGDMGRLLELLAEAHKLMQSMAATTKLDIDLV